MRSHDSNSGSNLESFLVGSKSNVGLLLTIRSHEGVDTADSDLVEFFTSLLDGSLLGSTVADEDEGVVVLNGLDSRLGGERVLDDGVGVEDIVVVLNTTSEGNRSILLGLGDGSSEGSVGPHSSLGVGVRSLPDLSSGSFSLTYRENGLGTLLPTISIYVNPERMVSAAHSNQSRPCHIGLVLTSLAILNVYC